MNIPIIKGLLRGQPFFICPHCGVAILEEYTCRTATQACYSCGKLPIHRPSRIYFIDRLHKARPDVRSEMAAQREYNKQYVKELEKKHVAYPLPQKPARDGLLESYRKKQWLDNIALQIELMIQNWREKQSIEPAYGNEIDFSELTIYPAPGFEEGVS